MLCGLSVTGCLGSLCHILIHLGGLDKFRGHGAYQVLVIVLHEAIELCVSLEVLLELVFGGVIEDACKHFIPVFPGLFGKQRIFQIGEGLVLHCRQQILPRGFDMVSPPRAAVEIAAAAAIAEIIKVLRIVSSLRFRAFPNGKAKSGVSLSLYSIFISLLQFVTDRLSMRHGAAN